MRKNVWMRNEYRWWAWLASFFSSYWPEVQAPGSGPAGLFTSLRKFSCWLDGWLAGWLVAIDLLTG